MTKVELEQMMTSFQKQIEEAMGAIRRLTQQQTSNIELLSRHESSLIDLKTELKKVENKFQSKAIHDNSIERYE